MTNDNDRSNWECIKSELIQIAYEIANCNEEHISDPDEALRIYSERYDNYLFSDEQIAKWNMVFATVDSWD